MFGEDLFFGKQCKLAFIGSILSVTDMSFTIGAKQGKGITAY